MFSCSRLFLLLNSFLTVSLIDMSELFCTQILGPLNLTLPSFDRMTHHFQRKCKPNRVHCSITLPITHQIICLALLMKDMSLTIMNIVIDQRNALNWSDEAE